MDRFGGNLLRSIEGGGGHERYKKILISLPSGGSILPIIGYQ
jgi:hypothetical protein